MNMAADIRYDRAYEQALDDLLGGELPSHLDANEARNLIAAIMTELWSPRRDFDRSADQHNQTCCVFARMAVEAVARKIAERIASGAADDPFYFASGDDRRDFDARR